MKKPPKDPKKNRRPRRAAKKHKLGKDYGRKLAKKMREICAEHRAQFEANLDM